MHERQSMEVDWTHKDRSTGSSAVDAPAFSLRIWMFMIPCAVPLLMLAFHYFEELETTGPVWEICSAPLLLAAVMAYVALLVVFKKRNW